MSDEIEFEGINRREVGGQPVWVRDPSEEDASPLDKRLDLMNHSPDGFQWGYGGSGPAQLALAMLAYLYDDETALEHYQQFKNDYISRLSGGWVIRESEIRNWMKEQ